MVISINGETNSIPFARLVDLDEGVNEFFEQVEASFNVNNIGDIELFGVELQAGGRYEVDVDGGGDTLLRVFDANGHELTFSDDETRRESPAETDFDDPYAQLIADYTGAYYFGISSIANTNYDPVTGGDLFSGGGIPTPSGSGTVRVTQFSSSTFFPADNTNNISNFGSSQANADYTDLTTESLEGNTAQRFAVPNGNVSGTDTDFIRFEAAKGDRIFVDLNHLNPGGGTRFEVFRGDTSIETVDPAGAAAAEGVFTVPFSSTGFYIGVTTSGVNITNPDTGATSGTGGSSQNFEFIFHKNWDFLGSNGVDNLDATFGDDRWVMRDGDDVVIALAGDDHISGGDGADRLEGRNGDDVLFGEAGDDVLRGENDDDILVGGLGDDRLIGNLGNDILEGGAGDDFFDGGQNDDVINGGAGNDNVFGSAGFDEIDGGAGDDILRGDNGDDIVRGGSGNDRLFGSFGADRLEGGFGDDILRPGPGDDVVAGGRGSDIIGLGGFGNNIIDYDGLPSLSDVDTYQDFDVDTDDIPANNDRVDLSDVVTIAVTAFNFNQVILTQDSGAGARLLVDPNGGAGGVNFQQIATVDGVSAADMADIDNFIF